MKNVLAYAISTFLSFFGVNYLKAYGVRYYSAPPSMCAPTDLRQELEFKAVQFYSGRKANGATFSAGIYESSDGVGVSTTVETYSSAAQAKNEMKKRIRKAARVIERSSKVDKNDKLIGERVVISVTRGTGNGAYATVLWANQEDLHIIESTSLRHALEFERKAME